MKGVTAWRIAGGSWHGYRMDASRTICACWPLRSRLWLSICFWATKDEQQFPLSQRPYPAPIRWRNRRAVARTNWESGGAVDGCGVRLRGSCVYLPAVVSLPAGADRNANAGDVSLGAGHRSCLPRRLGRPEPADAGPLLHRGAHGGRCFVQESQTRTVVSLPVAVSRDRPVWHVYGAELSPLVSLLGAEP